MSPRYPGQNPNPFSGAELGGLDLPAEEIADDARLARQLEALADRETLGPSPDFADRVMAAIASEPTPAPVVAARSAIRRLSLLGLVASVGDAARITFGRGFPAMARLQAISLVLVSSLTIGAAAAGTAGALGAFNAQNSSPGPTTTPTQLVTPTPTSSGEPGDSPAPSETNGPVDSSMAPEASGKPESSESPDPSGASESPRDDNPQATQTHGGGGSGSTGSATPGGSGGSGGSNPATPRPTSMPTPTATPDPSEDGGEPSPTEPPSESHTASPTPEQH